MNLAIPTIGVTNLGNFEIIDVSKSYGKQQVMDGLSLEIDEGEFLALVGPSGCGKSTLLRMIAGLEYIDSGEIVIAGRVVNNLPPKQRDIAMVFQNYALYPHMTVADNMSFALRLAKVPKSQIDENVKHTANILGLTDFLDRYPRTLSGGQRQRVAMGRAIVRKPKVFLFDEPLSNLDAKLRVQMRIEIKELHQRLGVTTVYVTHDQIEAMTMADRIVVMRDGKIEQVGSPLELYDKPANIFVAGFLGSPSMNFLNGKVDNLDEVSKFVMTDGINIEFEKKVETALSNAVLGIRAEHISLAENGIRATVLSVEPTGCETQIHASVGGQDVLVLIHERKSPNVGEVIYLKLNAKEMHLFDPKTGNTYR